MAFSESARVFIELVIESKPMPGIVLVDCGEKRSTEHPTRLEVHPCCCKLVEALVGDEHLTKRLEAIRPSIRFFDSLDVLQLGDGRAESIRGAKQLDERRIVLEGVLARKGEAFQTDAGLFEDDTIAMKTGERVLDVTKGGCRDDVAADEIAKLQERAQTLYHLGGYISDDRSKIELVHG